MITHYAIDGSEVPCGVHRRREVVLTRSDMRRRPEGGYATVLASVDFDEVTCKRCRRGAAIGRYLAHRGTQEVMA